MAVGQRGMVLVVEDDDSMRGAIERLLVAAGFGCTAFPSAEALLGRGVDEGSACVISDLRLPGMSGLDLLAALRQQRLSTPLIMITAHDAPGLCEAALSSGAAAYLAKPFRGTALLDALRAATEA